MVGSSKILTVSYGTFSCTLEGFDEPFSTMKAIAEYFRDLAAEDRYFGAEPPTPDAEMLHRIAEREIQRRVDTKISETGIVMRAELTEAPTAAPFAAAALDEAAPQQSAMPAPESDMPADVSEAVLEPSAEGLPEMDAAEAPETADFGMEDSPIDPFVEDEDISAPQAAFDAEPTDVAPPQAAPEGDSIAAKLMRIRAVVAAARTTTKPDTGLSDVTDQVYEEDLTSDFVAPPPADDFGFALELDDNMPAPRALDDGAAVQAVAATDERDLPEEETAPFASEPETSAADSESAMSRILAAEEHPASDWNDDEDMIAAPVSEMRFDAEDEDAVEAEPHDDDVDALDESDLPDDALDMALSEDQFEDESDLDSFDDAEDEPEISADAADMDGDTADEDAEILAGIGAVIGNTGLSADAEDELLRELAEVARDSRRGSHEGRTILENNPADENGAVERLMHEAKSKLEGDENRRRFSAISHLKAAVAATVADRKLKSRESPSESAQVAATDLDRYRDDLSKAVRPHKPASEQPSTGARPSSDLQATPLVLVSEQRIDAAPDPRQDHEVVRPRRVSVGGVEYIGTDAEPAGTESGALRPEEARSFAEFADRLGAASLSDLLEAAAAYTATVEGQPHFSRPQILQKVAHMSDDEDYSREDGLRSFGMLLREGKIQKISRGQFRISEASRFYE
ncbi:MAG: hypothetical protein WBC68_11025 [Albidovulum sp.]